MSDALPLQPRPLGRTGLMVSPIGLGTVKLGRSAGVRYPKPVRIPDDAEALALLLAAREVGINLIDTAPAYGTSEVRLGDLLQRAGGRDAWVICTKAGEEFHPGADSGRGASVYDFSPQGITASVERSLNNLRTDRLDLVLLHSDGRDEFILNESGALDALLALTKQGKIRAIGISTKSPKGTLLALERACDVIMVTLNPTELAEEPAIAAAAKRGVGVLIKKALASGHLDKISNHPLHDPVEKSLRFAFSHPGVSSVILGTTDPNHVRHNAQAAAKALPQSP